MCWGCKQWRVFSPKRGEGGGRAVRRLRQPPIPETEGTAVTCGLKDQATDREQLGPWHYRRGMPEHETKSKNITFLTFGIFSP